MNILMFCPALAACLLMTAILGYLGIHVLKREVIFIDIAMAQVAALGAILAHMFIHVDADSMLAILCAVGSTILAALFFSGLRKRVDILPVEAIIGITYAVVAAAALFIIGKSACGHSHVLHMLTGNLLWVSKGDLLWTTVVFAIAGSILVLIRRPLQEISDDYDAASAEGVNVMRWDFIFYALCGIAITLSVHLAGIVVVFCFLIIPATVSAIFSGKWSVRLLITWIVGLLGSVLGLLFSSLFDFSAGVSVALFLGIILAFAGTWSTILGRKGRKKV